MTAATALGWLDTLPGVRAAEPLAPHTTYRIGGPAERYVEVATAARLGEVVAGSATRGIPLLAVGSGSNLLVADAGVEGLVVRPSETRIQVDGDRVIAAPGARMVKVAQAAEAARLTGMEWALGIPGTVGGSVYNNAGCFGGEIAGVVEQVRSVGADGAELGHALADCAFRYRGSAFRDGRLAARLVTGVVFALKPGEPRAIKDRMDEVRRQRKETQPVTGRSTGSVFKNPPGDYAGRLVEATGLKGRSEGGAMVSREHANFIVNTGSASAGDVATLVRAVRGEVEARFQVRLELEMEAVGRWAPGELP